ncbi:MAG: SH3 domain-containing protein [Oscillospiraceae bacterium]|nr:SH3 domain-containing protein [Oscillospiraceae bacterium]
MSKRIFSGVLAVIMIASFLFGVPLQAAAVRQLSASEECIAFIKQIEGFSAVPYWDYNQWSVGFGTACPEEDLQRYQQQGITPEEADQLMQTHVQYFAKEVNRFMTRHNLQLTQQQFDALFSMCYNMGAAWLYDTGSRLVQAILKGTSGNELIYLMSLRNTAGGKFQLGLFHRRLMEADMYLNGRYNTKLPSDYGTVHFDSGKGKSDASIQGYDMNLPAQPLATATYEGHVFLGWYTKPDGGALVTQLDNATNGITLYARYEKIGAADHISGTIIAETVTTVQSSMLNIRTGPGTAYRVLTCVPAGTKLTITAVTMVGNSLWGKCDLGWLSLAHTDFAGSDGAEGDEGGSITTPADATVMAATITVYNGPHTSYPKRGTLKQGQRIQLLELQNFLGQQWARFEGGWVRVDRNLMIHDETVLAHPFTATVTNSYLNVRTGPGTSYSLAATLAKQDRVLILAVTVVDGVVWGRCYQGWISLSYTNFDRSQLPHYQNHSFGSWYDVSVSGATGTVLQRRDCDVCGHYETRQMEYTPSGIYGTVTGCEVLNVRAAAGAGNAWVGSLKKGDRVEIYELTTVNGKLWGRCHKGWICLTGYVTLEETTVMTVTAYQLNIRAGAGSSYSVVGVLSRGAQVQILEIQTVDGKRWARIDGGWVSMNYLE